LQLEHVDGQLTADDHAGTLNANPAVVVILRVVAGRYRDMVVRVEYTDDLPVHLDGVGHEHVTFEAAHDTLGNRGLAVAGFAEQEHPAAGVYGGTDRIERLAVDHDVRERHLQIAWRHRLSSDRLIFERFDVVPPRNRAGTYVGGVVKVAASRV